MVEPTTASLEEPSFHRHRKEAVRTAEPAIPTDTQVATRTPMEPLLVAALELVNIPEMASLSTAAQVATTPLTIRHQSMEV